MQIDYNISKIIRNRSVRAELFDLGFYPIIHTPLNDVPVDVIPEWCHMKALQVNRYKRVRRLRLKVADIVSSRSLFLTLTFTDAVLSSTNPKTRRLYVSRLLGAFKVPYVANLDYGSANGREHYHALIQLERIDAKLWVYGNLDFKRVRTPNDLRLSRYITKLTYHAIKTPTRVIYPKKIN